MKRKAIGHPAIEDFLLITRDIHTDNRGLITEILNNSDLGNNFSIEQVSFSYSKKGTFRGIHRTPYAKVVTCISGNIIDYCVDMRVHNNSFSDAEVHAEELTETNLHTVFIPAFCGHAFIAQEDSIVLYLQNAEYHPGFDESFCYKMFNNLKLPFEPKFISDKDAKCD